MAEAEQQLLAFILPYTRSAYIFCRPSVHFGATDPTCMQSRPGCTVALSLQGIMLHLLQMSWYHNR